MRIIICANFFIKNFVVFVVRYRKSRARESLSAEASEEKVAPPKTEPEDDVFVRPMDVKPLAESSRNNLDTEKKTSAEKPVSIIRHGSFCIRA